MNRSGIDEIIAFIERWSNGTQVSRYRAEPLPDTLPRSILALNDRLGGFWKPPPFPFGPAELDHNTERGLFDVQDYIVNPNEVVPDEGGITPLIHENQGNWAFGYSEDHKLLIKGDWITDKSDQRFFDWVHFPAEIEDALIYTLLLNFYFYSGYELNEKDRDFEKSTTVLLWSNPNWSTFWTNEKFNILLFEGFAPVKSTP